MLKTISYLLLSAINVLFFVFLYFVFIRRLYKGQAKRYYNASLNNFYIKKDTHKKKENEKEREVRKEAYYSYN